MLTTIVPHQHLLHNTDGVHLEGHPFVSPEVPARAEILRQAVAEAALGPIVAPTDYGLAPLLAVHDAEFVEFLRTVFAQNAAHYKAPLPVFGDTFWTRGALHKPSGFLGQVGYYAFGVDSPILEGTWEAAYWSAQAALTAVDRVRGGERLVYALCRPPGHHAAADQYGGFCYLNHAAIAARALGDHVAILDIDYHHGNGTQMIFFADPGVLFCSLHADPDDEYPFYWGAADERGSGPGLGFNHNWPLPQGTEDAAYLAALDEALAVIRSFAPSALVVSAGLDIAAGDPIGGFNISPAGLSTIGQRIAALSTPTVVVQEGGYLLGRLAENGLALLQGLSSAMGR